MNFLMFFVCCLFLVVSKVVAQFSSSLSPIILVQPNQCNTTSQYFDISHLQCLGCPANSQPVDYFNCRCNQNFYYAWNNGGGSIVCVQCPTGFIQSLDGYNCVYCDTACKDCAKSGGYRRDLDENGQYYTDAQNNLVSKCFFCNKAVSTLNDATCATCKSKMFTESSTNITATTCDSNTILSLGGMLILDGSAFQDPAAFNVVFGTDSTINSWYFSTYLVAQFRTCRTASRRNVTACQGLANLCVLNLYNNVQSNNVDACQAFNAIAKTSTGSNGAVWVENMPWLTYFENYGTLISYYRSTGTNDLSAQYIYLKFDNKCKPSLMSFVSAEYSLNGSLTRVGNFDVNRMQLCNLLSSNPSGSPTSPFSSTNFQQSCSVSLKLLLDLGSQPIFYDFYLQYASNSKMLPVPVKTLNYKDASTGFEINRDATNENSHKLQRRFFLADSVSAKQGANSAPKYVRYAKSINLRFDLVEGQNQGKIYPPFLIVDYDYVSTEDLSKSVQVSFQIEYRMNLDSHVQAIWISVGIMSFLAILWAIFRTWIWSRRSGKLAVDVISLFKFFMFFITGVSNVLFVVTVGVSLYWLIFYKGQDLAYVLLPQPYQEYSFMAILLIGFFAKFVDVVHMILVQCSYDVFFIDWERPKVEPHAETRSMKKVGESKAAETSQNKVSEDMRNMSKVSCWRSLFVANEWNEIQTFRRINPILQLLFVLFFLKVVNLEALTTSDCNTSINKDPNQYQGIYSGILRVAMASAIFIGFAIVQYLTYNFIYIRCINDKIGQFIDFCSVANVSMFIMTHSQFGYYIHGRSPHGNADTNMQMMAQALLKEENDLTAKRGLEEGSDHQTFSILIPDKLSKQYSKVMIPLYDRKIQRSNVAGSFNAMEFEKRINAYTQLNRFLIAFIDNILREMRYIVIKRNFIENILDLELREPITSGYFYADEDKSFVNAIFCGSERKLLAFDLLTFLVVDYFAKNYILASLVTFIVIQIYEVFRSDLSKRNISRKTLVDKRFLI